MINIQKLNFQYPKRAPLFQDLSCELSAGSITGLLGKNGAGKTSLLKMMTGLLFPHSGAIQVNGHIPMKREPSHLENLFFVSEEFFLPAISGKQFVKANAPFYPRFDQSLLDELVNSFELPDTHNLQKLSYGQKKKFLISFALATKCRLLVLDEPTNGLDIPSKSIFRKCMAGALDEDQLVLISTHQVKDVENLIDRILILDEGKFVMQKEMHEISSKLRFANSSVAEGEEILYSEASPSGYRVITPGDSSHVDIELLFNAVTQGTQKLKSYVN